MFIIPTSELSDGIRCVFHHAEDISLRIVAIDEPAHFGDFHLGDHDGSSLFLNFFDICVDRGNIDRADESRRTSGSHFHISLQKPSIDARLILWSGHDHPVVHIASFPFCKFPRKYIGIESNRSKRIHRLDLKMNYAFHRKKDKKLKSELLFDQDDVNPPGHHLFVYDQDLIDGTSGTIGFHGPLIFERENIFFYSIHRFVEIFDDLLCPDNPKDIRSSIGISW